MLNLVILQCIFETLDIIEDIRAWNLWSLTAMILSLVPVWLCPLEKFILEGIRVNFRRNVNSSIGLCWGKGR